MDGPLGVGDGDRHADRERIGQHVDALAEQPGLETESRGRVVVCRS